MNTDLQIEVRKSNDRLHVIPRGDFDEADKAMALAPGGSKVTVASEAHICRCKGKCKQCKCLGPANTERKVSK